MSSPLFDRSTVDQLAALAALSLDEAEADAFARDLGAVVAHVAQLASVDTSSIEPSPLTYAETWRSDTLVPGLNREDALRAAPRSTEDGFAVPGFVSASATHHER